GHAKPTTTLAFYAHWLPAADRVWTERLELARTSSPGSPRVFTTPPTAVSSGSRYIRVLLAERSCTFPTLSCTLTKVPTTTSISHACRASCRVFIKANSPLVLRLARSPSHKTASPKTARPACGTMHRAMQRGCRGLASTRAGRGWCARRQGLD